MELLDVPAFTSAQALDGMRRPFLKAFGRGPVGRRLARAAWPAFRAALLHGSGIALARSHARVAADERNAHTLLVARWTHRRIESVVHRAVQDAANAV